MVSRSLRSSFAAALFLPVFLLCALLTSVTANAETVEEVEAAITAFNTHYLAAINNGDIEALAALTPEDHMMVSGGSNAIVGKEALVSTMTGVFERFTIDESWTPQQTVVSGDLAYQRGTFVVEATPKAGGDTTRATGSFMRMYRRQPDGGWFMVLDTHESD